MTNWLAYDILFENRLIRRICQRRLQAIKSLQSQVLHVSKSKLFKSTLLGHSSDHNVFFDELVTSTVSPGYNKHFKKISLKTDRKQKISSIRHFLTMRHTDCDAFAEMGILRYKCRQYYWEAFRDDVYARFCSDLRLPRRIYSSD